ncbi:MAG: HEAT repeat domain-containing protein [Planctomycetia bacterium]|nr:HEAT repeat domain-containing protein [Planctomycetia bacterium]
MRRYRGTNVLALAVSVGLMAGSGCATAPRAQWPSWMAFGKKEEDGPKILTPHDKMVQMRELATRLPKYSPELQEQVAAELVQAIPHEQDPVLRAQILRTLGVCPTESAARILAAGLNDHNRDVRIAACDAWGKRGGPEATTELSRALTEDADIDVRLAAARNLGTVEHPNAIAPLGQALEDPDPAMQRRAMASLKQTSGRDYGNNVQAWREFVQGRQPAAPQESFVQRIFKWF